MKIPKPRDYDSKFQLGNLTIRRSPTGQTRVLNFMRVSQHHTNKVNKMNKPTLSFTRIYLSNHTYLLRHIDRMFSRLTYLPRRCSCSRRFYSKEKESNQNEVSEDNGVKVNSVNSSRLTQGDHHVNSIPIDRRLQMHRLRNNFVLPGPGLKSSKNRNDLVAEFFDLSKSVMEGRLTVDELKESKTFLYLGEQLNFHVDIMSNNQIINLVASLVKMQFDSSANMLRLLEHEVKFRINSLTLTQVLKLSKFYNAIETSYEQKQLVDILNNRIRSMLLSNRTSIKDLIEIYHHLAEQNGQTNMLSLTEEKMLNLLTEIDNDEDDLVSQYLPKMTPHDYNSLCKIFIELASVKRRPTPLLKAASNTLHKLPFPKDEENSPNISTLINTLSSLVSLNYTNRLLVSKLVTDLTAMINLDELDLITQCNLLRTIGSLKWRPEKLLELFYNHVKTHKENLKKVDHNMILTLFHITAHLNYKHEGDIRKFYNECMQGMREGLIDRNSRKWLNYVWSLAVLDVATDEHYDSVLNDDFIKAIENPLGLQKINHADIMRLLNLQALAILDGRSKESRSKLLDELAQVKIQRGSDMQKFAAKIKDALSGIVKSSENPSLGKQTPFGFVVDCGLKLDIDSEIEVIDDRTMEVDLTTSPDRPVETRDSNTKIALIHILFDEALASHPNEPVGHKRIISRILDKVGYKTIFIQEGIFNRFKTSADLAVRLKEIIKEVGSKELKSVR